MTSRAVSHRFRQAAAAGAVFLALPFAALPLRPAMAAPVALHAPARPATAAAHLVPAAWGRGGGFRGGFRGGFGPRFGDRDDRFFHRRFADRDDRFFGRRFGDRDDRFFRGRFFGRPFFHRPFFAGRPFFRRPFFFHRPFVFGRFDGVRFGFFP